MLKVDSAIADNRLGARPLLGFGGLAILVIGCAIAIVSGMGSSGGLFVVAPTIGVAALFAVIGLVRKERPLWPALLTLTLLTLPICLEWLDIGKGAFHWLARQ
jgi:hypothetical protein